MNPFDSVSSFTSVNNPCHIETSDFPLRNNRSSNLHAKKEPANENNEADLCSTQQPLLMATEELRDRIRKDHLIFRSVKLQLILRHGSSN